MNKRAQISCQLDHLVVCAQSCTAGIDWFASLTGITLPAGGKHPLMATHNHLTALSLDTFLEIIAIDPLAPPISVPRWFALDDPLHQEKLASHPRLSTWVVRTTDLDASLAAAEQAGVDAGEPVSLSRGELHWRLALRRDGSLACQGLFPILIEWPTGINPVKNMQDQGVRLDRLMLGYDDVTFLQQALKAIGAEELAEVSVGDSTITAGLHAGDHAFQLTN